MKQSRLLLTAVFWGILVLVIDIISKNWIQNHIPLILWQSPYPYGGIPVFYDFFGINFSIVHVINHGAAWGSFGDYKTYLVFLRILLIIGMAIYLLAYNQKRSWVIPLTLVLFGALGNVIDYFVYGHVIDMFYFVFWGYGYPVFNVADIAVSLGICWIIFVTPFLEHQQARHD